MQEAKLVGVLFEFLLVPGSMTLVIGARAPRASSTTLAAVLSLPIAFRSLPIAFRSLPGAVNRLQRAVGVLRFSVGVVLGLSVGGDGDLCGLDVAAGVISVAARVGSASSSTWRGFFVGAGGTWPRVWCSPLSAVPPFNTETHATTRS